MAIKSFNSAKAAEKWKQLTMLSEDTFRTIASGKAVQQDYDNIANILAQQSQVASDVFNLGISAIQAGADDISTIVQSRVKAKGGTLTDKQLVKLNQVAFAKVFEEKYNDLVLQIAQELAKVQPEIDSALQQYAQAQQAYFDSFTERVKGKFDSVFDYARDVAKQKKKAQEEQVEDSKDELGKFAELWEKELYNELERRKKNVIERLIFDITESVSSKWQQVITSSRNYYWQDIESYTKHDVEVDAMHLERARRLKEAEFASKEENKGLDKKEYDEKLQAFLEQQMAAEKAYLYKLKHDEPARYSRLRKLYIKSNAKAFLKYNMKFIQNLLKGLYNKAKEKKGSILATIASTFVLYRLLRYELIPKLFAPIWKQFKEAASSWVDVLSPDLAKWIGEAEDSSKSALDNVSKEVSDTLEGAKPKWDSFYEKLFKDDDSKGDDKGWVQSLFNMVKEMFTLDTVKDIFATVYRYIVGRLGDIVGAVTPFLPGGDSLHKQIKAFFAKLKINENDNNKATPSNPGSKPQGAYEKKKEDKALSSSIAQSVYAPATGKVVSVDKKGDTASVGIQDNEGNIHTVYNLHKNQVSAQIGQHVTQGDYLGYTYQAPSTSISNNADMQSFSDSTNVKVTNNAGNLPSESPSVSINGVPSQANASASQGSGNLQTASDSLEKQYNPANSTTPNTKPLSGRDKQRGANIQNNTGTLMSGANRDNSDLAIVVSSLLYADH